MYVSLFISTLSGLAPTFHTELVSRQHEDILKNRMWSLYLLPALLLFMLKILNQEKIVIDGFGLVEIYNQCVRVDLSCSRILEATRTLFVYGCSSSRGKQCGYKCR